MESDIQYGGTSLHNLSDFSLCLKWSYAVYKSLTQNGHICQDFGKWIRLYNLVKTYVKDVYCRVLSYAIQIYFEYHFGIIIFYVYN